MPSFVKTKKDEELWSKAKDRAKDAGKEDNWAYVTGIFKKMKGDKLARMSREERRMRAKKALSVLMEEGMEDEIKMPSELRRLSADRMREMGRSLMVAGMRAPRQQIVAIAVTLDGLLEQLKLLGEQNPGLNALRRRILLNLRNKTMGA